MGKTKRRTAYWFKFEQPRPSFEVTHIRKRWQWMNVTWPEPHKNKNIILPETAIDNQQNRYNNGQDSWAVCKGVDPKKESKSRHTCKRRWTTYCCIVSGELRRNFTTASTTHMWSELWKSSPTTAVLLPLVFVPCEPINKCSSFVEKSSCIVFKRLQKLKSRNWHLQKRN